MVDFGPEHVRGLRRIALAILSGWLLSWLGVAALVTLSVVRPHNPIPRVLLVVWAGAVVLSLAIPNASFGAIRGKGSVLFLILTIPFVPLACAASAVWPHLPETVKDLLEGNFRRRRSARLQRKRGE
jgi:hypothetical protein